ncbi:LacI family DNA-binding transcriptional regulator [Streptomyces sp. FXJ1.172]|uniref:LacI family DNA-binding transcriptional regulator n=1 Tax=Streptomyces sp. FXJ1.172 TaxID=710705 RepID=UPI0007CF2FA8|nr:LacI family DNA-binding transcriptional regulator [Streptomyces sp. FXJ1.172]WEO99389.1 LacI family DNA-binding transcriptional regulator [Streptomyces sp. FXJ1.172]
MARKAAAAVTSADVARLAGVSRATVSFVLNNTQAHRVSEPTRAKVLAAADTLGYVPHAAARSLRAGRTNLVLIPAAVSAVGRLVSGWIDELHTELERYGYTAVLHAGRYADPATAARAWAELRPGAVLALDGASLTPAGAQVLRRAGVHALMALAPQPVEGVYTVIFDHRRVGVLATEHLVAGGRRRIGVVMPRERGLSAFAEPRLAGARSVAARTPAIVTAVDMEHTHACAVELAHDWAARGLDGVFAYNDEYAALLLHALRDAGVDVPGEVAVVGCDDLVTAALQRPPLTTVRLDAPPAAQLAAALHDLIETGTAAPLPAVEPVLVRRESA